jgi:hypothetical protein
MFNPFLGSTALKVATACELKAESMSFNPKIWICTVKVFRLSDYQQLHIH